VAMWGRKKTTKVHGVGKNVRTTGSWQNNTKIPKDGSKIKRGTKEEPERGSSPLEKSEGTKTLRQNPRGLRKKKNGADNVPG